MSCRLSCSALILLFMLMTGPVTAHDSGDQSSASATATEERSIIPAPEAALPSTHISSPAAKPPSTATEPLSPPVASTRPESPAEEGTAPVPPLPAPSSAEPMTPTSDAKPAEVTGGARKEPAQTVIPFEVNLSPAPPQPKVEIPDDPCLPRLYKDWQEMSLDSQEREIRNGLTSCRITIDRSSFQLWLEAIRRDGSVDEIYRTHVGLGDVNSPTPEGNFVINHVYCYPDVVYFDASGKKVPGLYNGFFAPLLLCEDRKRCRRYHDLGMHGFQGSAARRHNVAVTSLATYGAISAGCIRVPDPCRLKSELIRLVGIGPVKKDDRGTYHWLARPVEVVITGYYPGTEDRTTLVSVFEQSLEQVHGGIKDFLGLFGH